ncbi:MAG: hypothetical protein NTW86_25225 [Candidatus Sumerlaeota bacterium]|nr:hypothetical protein [Candidatus Sumerlaeota bacterium]
MRDCGGDVSAALAQAWAGLTRLLADLPAHQAALAIRWRYCPRPADESLQSRLALFIIIASTNSALVETLSRALESSLLKRLYGLSPSPLEEVPWESFRAASDLVRREQLTRPLHGREFNDRSPAAYYEIDPFEPSVRDDSMALDQVLGRRGEWVAIEVAAEPVDLAAERHRHTAYLAELQSVNRRWDGEEDASLLELTYATTHGLTWNRSQGVLRPLRREDPLAEDVRRCQQQFHETLRRPHLRFHARVLAETPAAAHLVSSVLAESAFDGGNYRLFHTADDDPVFHRAIHAARNLRLEPFPSHERLITEEGLGDLYAGFRRLAHVATTEELAGLFRLPVAVHGSPRCIRANTDPPALCENEMIILGWDEEPSDERE